MHGNKEDSIVHTFASVPGHGTIFVFIVLVFKVLSSAEKSKAEKSLHNLDISTPYTR